MIVKVSPGDLGKEIEKQLKDWGSVEVRRAANEGIKETAEKAEKLLKQGGPYQERTKKYTKDWTHDLRRKALTTGLDEYSVHNRKHYQLTHLLEHGHQSRNGGRVRALEHIAPVNELVETLAVSNVGKKIREIVQ